MFTPCPPPASPPNPCSLSFSQETTVHPSSGLGMISESKTRVSLTVTRAEVDLEEARWPGLKRVTSGPFICSDNKYFLTSQEASGFVLGMGSSGED